jgi:hypothetical protein
MGSITLASPFQSLTSSLFASNQNMPAFGNALTPYKYTGTQFAVALDPSGRAVTIGSPTVPADAVAMELWSANNVGASDYLFWASRSAVLAGDNTGNNANDLISNTAKNNGSSGSAPQRFVVNGAHFILPFNTVGTAPTGWRFARGSTGLLTFARFLASSSNFPYLAAGTEEFIVVGANNVQQMPTGTAAKFPTGYGAAVFQVIGGAVRMTSDGTDPTSSNGDLVAAGTYYVDQSAHGLSLAALKFYMSTGTFIVGHSLTYA